MVVDPRYPDLTRTGGIPVPEVANAAMIYDYDVGGCNNRAVDRAASAEIARVIGDNGSDIAVANRAFLGRAVRYCLDRGITQFLDLGSGIPTVGNVHEVAQRQNPNARVVYVDNEPVAVARTQNLLASNTAADIVPADLRDPASVLNSEPVRRLIRPDEPAVLLLVAALHYVDHAAESVLRTYTDALAPGSMLVISQITADEREAAAARAQQWFAENTGTPLTMRSHAEITHLLQINGWALEDPGLVWSPQWHPDPADPGVHPPQRSATWAGVAHLPS